MPVAATPVPSNRTARVAAVPFRRADGPPVAVELSRHAVERYAERLKAGFELPPGAVAAELLRLAALGVVVEEPPGWCASPWATVSDFHLVIGDLVLPLAPHGRHADRLVAKTCLARGELSPEARERRRAGRRRRRPDRPGRRPRCAEELDPLDVLAWELDG
jgi:hypothetical protein